MKMYSKKLATITKKIKADYHRKLEKFNLKLVKNTK